MGPAQGEGASRSGQAGFPRRFRENCQLARNCLANSVPVLQIEEPHGLKVRDGEAPTKFARQAAGQGPQDLLLVRGSVLAPLHLLDDAAPDFEIGVDLHLIHAARDSQRRIGDELADALAELGREVHSSFRMRFSTAALSASSAAIRGALRETGSVCHDSLPHHQIHRRRDVGHSVRAVAANCQRCILTRIPPTQAERWKPARWPTNSSLGHTPKTRHESRHKRMEEGIECEKAFGRPENDKGRCISVIRRPLRWCGEGDLNPHSLAGASTSS